MFSKKEPETLAAPQETRRFTDRVGSMETVIGQAVTITGELQGDENVRLNGTVKGNINVKSTLHIAPTGKAEGDVRSDNVIIEGSISGDVHAADRVELRDGAQVRGNIHAVSIAISEGAFFEGSVKMHGKTVAAETPFKFSEKRNDSEGSEAVDQ